MKILDKLKLRAARQLLDWSQSDLTRESGVALSTIAQFESKPDRSLTDKNLNAILAAFYRCGVEITADGVRYINRDIVRYEGQEGFNSFRRDLYQTMRNGGEILVSNVDERDFEKWDGGSKAAEMHFKKMRAIQNLSMKILVKEGDTNFAASSYAQYRWVSQSLYSKGVPLYIYGDKTAVMLFSPDHVKIFVITEPQVTESFKKQFMNIWDEARVAG